MPAVFRRLFSPFVILFVAAVFNTLWVSDSPWSAGSIVRAQDNQTGISRLVLTERGMPIDPIQVVSFKEGEEPVIPGVAFDASDIWLKNLSVTIKNVSIKDITRVEVDFAFLDTGDGTAGHPFLSHRYELGEKPPHALYSHSGEKIEQTLGPPLLLQPGHELTVPFASDFDDMKAEIETVQPMSTIRRCRVEFSVYFADGTRWAHGGYYLPDLDHPGRYSGVSFQKYKEYSAPK